jgi:hypothetical protein
VEIRGVVIGKSVIGDWRIADGGRAHCATRTGTEKVYNLFTVSLQKLAVKFSAR